MINDIEKDLLQRILNDEPLLSAIRKVFDGTIESQRPTVFLEDSNELLGERYRAYELSKKMIEQGFIDLRSYKISKDNNKSFNKGR